VDELKAALRQAVIANKVTPVYCGSSLRNKGVQPVLDAVIDYLPSPDDMPAGAGTTRKLRTIERPAEDDEPLSALVFKIVTDPYVGRLAYSGFTPAFGQGSMVYNSTKEARAHWPPDPHVCRPPRRCR
jgi:elongation factor G